MCEVQEDTGKAQHTCIYGVSLGDFLCHFHKKGDLNVPLDKIINFYYIASWISEFSLRGLELDGL